MAKDKIHYIVKESLIKNGWKITHDPYYLKVLDVLSEIYKNTNHQNLTYKIKNEIRIKAETKKQD